MAELLVDFISSLEGHGAAEGWPGWWGLEGPEYLAWLDQDPHRDDALLMGTTTYRLMSGFAGGPAGLRDAETDSVSELTAASKVVFSSSLGSPPDWANTRLVQGDAVREVRAMKEAGVSMRTIGSRVFDGRL